jgi:hypothetical protein
MDYQAGVVAEWTAKITAGGEEDAGHLAGKI